MAIVLAAVLRIGKRVLKNRTMVVMAAMSFIAIFFFNAPFPALIAAAAIIGFVGGRVSPERFVVIMGHGSSKAGQPMAVTLTTCGLLGGVLYIVTT